MTFDEAKTFITEMMRELGSLELIPAKEIDPDSIWVMDDKAPNGDEGYYRKKHVPAPHRIVCSIQDAFVTFEMDGKKYRIQCRHLPTGHQNLVVVADVIQTIQTWVARGLVKDLKTGLAPFSQGWGHVEWFYILRVAPDATRTEIDEAYKRRAAVVHPDHGGSHEEFIRLQRAYQEARELVP